MSVKLELAVLSQKLPISFWIAHIIASVKNLKIETVFWQIVNKNSDKDSLLDLTTFVNTG